MILRSLRCPSACTARSTSRILAAHPPSPRVRARVVGYCASSIWSRRCSNAWRKLAPTGGLGEKLASVTGKCSARSCARSRDPAAAGPTPCGPSMHAGDPAEAGCAGCRAASAPARDQLSKVRGTLLEALAGEQIVEDHQRAEIPLRFEAEATAARRACGRRRRGLAGRTPSRARSSAVVRFFGSNGKSSTTGGRRPWYAASRPAARERCRTLRRRRTVPRQSFSLRDLRSPAPRCRAGGRNESRTCAGGCLRCRRAGCSRRCSRCRRRR